MSATHKPRSDAKLKTLPEERQEAIIEMFRDKSLAQIKRELAQDGLVTSASALSEFYSWWQMRRQFTEAETESQTLMDLLRKQDPNLTEEQIYSYGQQVFSLKAMRSEDSLSWYRVQRLRHQREVIGLERSKFQRETCELFLKWFHDQKAREIAEDTGLSRKDKIETLGQQMFGELWD